MTELENCCTDANDSINDLDNRVTELENCCTDVRDDINNLDNRLTELENCCTDANDSINDLDNRVTELENCCNNLQPDIDLQTMWFSTEIEQSTSTHELYCMGSYHEIGVATDAGIVDSFAMHGNRFFA